MEITKREIIASIAIVAIMLVIGFFISDKITDYENDKNAEYQKAVHIEDTELFQYGMDTNIGNSFVYGDLEAVDTVTYPEIGGEYIYVEKVEEHYNMHTRQVAHTRTVNGKTQIYYTTEIYYSWDYAGSEEQRAKEIKFCGIVLPSNKISLPSTDHIDTIKESSHIRYKYYGIPTKHTGTIYTKLSDGTISDDSRFFEDYTIDEALDSCTSGIANIIFWVVWVIMTGGLVAGFYYLDNWWLED